MVVEIKSHRNLDFRKKSSYIKWIQKKKKYKYVWVIFIFLIAEYFFSIF